MTEHAVVIAGGGPTGLMLAGELALAGVGVRRLGRVTPEEAEAIQHEVKEAAISVRRAV